MQFFNMTKQLCKAPLKIKDRPSTDYVNAYVDITISLEKDFAYQLISALAPFHHVLKKWGTDRTEREREANEYRLRRDMESEREQRRRHTMLFKALKQTLRERPDYHVFIDITREPHGKHDPHYDGYNHWISYVGSDSYRRELYHRVRARSIIRMRKEGMTWSAIAKEWKTTANTVAAAVKSYQKTKEGKRFYKRYF